MINPHEGGKDMKTLAISGVLALALTLTPVAAGAGDNPVQQPVPGVSQQVNDTQLSHFKGKVGDPADLSQASSTIPTTLQVVGDTINFAEDVMATMKGYNTHPPNNPAIGPAGHTGPGGNIGPSWLQGKDITIRR
jgi:hypothetical protein